MLPLEGDGRLPGRRHSPPATPLMKAATSFSSIATLQPEPRAYDSGCGCATQDQSGGEPPIDVDPAIKDRNQKRLRRIEGQIRGLQRMVDEDRSCADIMTQISSAHEALRAVGRELMRGHLKHCASAAISSSNGQAEPMYDELIEMMYKLSR